MKKLSVKPLVARPNGEASSLLLFSVAMRVIVATISVATMLWAFRYSLAEDDIQTSCPCLAKSAFTEDLRDDRLLVLLPEDGDIPGPCFGMSMWHIGINQLFSFEDSNDNKIVVDLLKRVRSGKEINVPESTIGDRMIPSLKSTLESGFLFGSLVDESLAEDDLDLLCLALGAAHNDVRDACLQEYAIQSIDSDTFSVLSHIESEAPPNGLSLAIVASHFSHKGISLDASQYLRLAANTSNCFWIMPRKYIDRIYVKDIVLSRIEEERMGLRGVVVTREIVEAVLMDRAWQCTRNFSKSLLPLLDDDTRTVEQKRQDACWMICLSARMMSDSNGSVPQFLEGIQLYEKVIKKFSFKEEELLGLRQRIEIAILYFSRSLGTEMSRSQRMLLAATGKSVREKELAYLADIIKRSDIDASVIQKACDSVASEISAHPVSPETGGTLDDVSPRGNE